MVVLLVLTVAAAGCGGSGGPSKPRRNVKGFAGVDIPEADAPSTPAPAPQSQPQQQETTAPPQEAVEQAQAEVATVDENGTTVQATAAAPSSEAREGGEEREADGEEPVTGASGRPSSVNDWKIPQDFYIAAAARDSQLGLAIEAAGKRHRNNAEAARTWIDLLAPSGKAVRSPAEADKKGTGSAEGRPRPPLPRPGPEVAKKLIAALARNRTPVGREAVKKLLTGKVPLPIDRRELLTTAVAALAEQLDPASEKILFVLATKPQRFVEMPLVIYRDVNPAGGAGRAVPREEGQAGGESPPPLPDWLVNEVLRAVGQRASADFRTKLAEYLKDPQVPIEIAAPIETFLATDDTKNLQAQVILYLNEHTSDSIQTQIADRLSRLSGEAIARLQGLSATGPLALSEDRYDRQPIGTAATRQSKRPSLAPARPTFEPGTGADLAPDRRPYQLAPYLWKPETVDVLRKRIAAAETLEGNNKALYMLGTIPLEAARRAMNDLLDKHAADGAQVWSSAGLMGTSPADPAMLVLAKSVYHPAAGKKSHRRPRRAGRERGGVQDTANDPWATETDRFVTQLCTQFQAASSRTVKLSDQQRKSLPIGLFRNAHVTAFVHVRWPEDVPGELAELGIAPLELYYIRTEDEVRPRLVRSHYERKVRGGKKHTQGDVLWLDGLRRMVAKGTARSVDVRITGLGQTGQPEQGRGANEEKPVTVEILTVEVPDPEAETPSPRTGT